MSRRGRRYRKENRSGKFWITCIVLALLIVMSVQIANIHEKNEEYTAKEESLLNALEEETERQAEMEEYEKYIQSQDYVEDVAKSKLGLVYENEIVFKEEKE